MTEARAGNTKPEVLITLSLLANMGSMRSKLKYVLEWLSEMLCSPVVTVRASFGERGRRSPLFAYVPP